MRSLLGAFLVLLTVALAAQQQPPPVFRAGTDLVEVDVVVHDKNGYFVPDLTASDFTIEEGGRPREIEQFFVRRSNGGTAPGVAPLAGRDPALATPATRVFVVVFDDAHLSVSGFKRTQAAALSLFSQQFKPGDIGGVVTRGRMAMNRLTTDRDELLKAVKDAKPDGSKSSRMFDERTIPRLSDIEAVRIIVNNDRDVLAAAIRRLCNDDPDLCRKVDPEPLVREKASQLTTTVRVESERTLDILRALVDGLTRFEGRKTVLLMSEGFVAEESWPVVQEVVVRATRANARIYTLEARGLDHGLPSVNDLAPDREDVNARLLAQMDFGADSINSLAVDTGGFVVRNTNQFDKAIARIADEVNNYYVLGYRAGAAPDGKFHRISVKINRPDVAIRARRGYVALPRAATTTTSVSPAAAAPARATVPPPVADAEPPPVAAPAVPEAAPAVSVTGAVLPRGSNTAGGFRVRPDAAEHAKQLASVVPDADASAGWDAYQRGDVESAREKLALAAARDGAQSWVHYTLGMSQYALGQFRDAAQSWEHVRDSATDFEPVYFDLIDAYLQLKEHDHSIRVARAGLERWPQDAELFEALGVVQTVRGSLDDAIKSFQAAVAIAPADPTGYFNLGKATEMRYFRSRRYVNQLRRWVANETDRTIAVENYERYIALGGSYAEAARDGLTRLKWTPAAK